MRVTKRDISAKDGEGSVKITAEVPEDVWHVYNILQATDVVTAGTTRKIAKDIGGGPGGSDRVRINLSVAVENIVFDTDLGELRVSGKVVNENAHVKKGSYHTLELGAAGASRSAAHIFTLHKLSWDAEALRRLREASKPGANSDIIGIAISSTQAVVCLVSEHMTIVRASFEPHIPRARGDGTGQKKAVEALYGTIYEALLSTAEGRFADLKLIIVAGPGFMKSAFFDFAMAKATRDGNKDLLAIKGKFAVVDATGGHKRSLEEAMRDPVIAPMLEDTKAAGEVKALAEFWNVMREDSDRAVYGPRHVAYTASCGSVGTLLICDELLRSSDPVERRFYVRMTEDVEENGGQLLVFSSLHASGQALMEIGGVAGMLRAGIPDLDMLIDQEAARKAHGPGGAGAAAAASSGEADTAMAALERAIDGTLRLRDGAESVTTDNSSIADWEVEGGDPRLAGAVEA